MQIGKIISPHDLRGATINRSNSITRGLVGAWNPNVFPAGNTLYDRSGYGHNGALESSVDWAIDGTYGHVLDFAGHSDVITIPYDASLEFSGNDHISILVWHYGTATPDGRLITQANEIVFRYTSGTLQLILNSFSTNDRASISAGSAGWHLGYATYDGDSLTVGLEDSSSSVSPTGTYGGNTLAWDIGGASTVGNEPFNGEIGQTLIFTRALSAAEIASLYHDPYQIWDVGDDEMEWAKAAAGNPYWYYNMLKQRRRAC